MLPEKQQFTGVNIGIYTDSEFSEIEILTQVKTIKRVQWEQHRQHSTDDEAIIFCFWFFKTKKGKKEEWNNVRMPMQALKSG